MEIVTSWELEAMERIVIRQIRKRFGIVSEETINQVNRLDPEPLMELGEALFDFTSLADMEAWLALHGE